MANLPADTPTVKSVPQLLARKAVMRLLDISPMTLWRLEQDHGLPRLTLPAGGVRYRESDVQEYLESLSGFKV